MGYAPLLTLTFTEGLEMRFKIKVNHQHIPPEWWLPPFAGLTDVEADACVFTDAEVKRLVRTYGLSMRREPGVRAWLSLKLVP